VTPAATGPDSLQAVLDSVFRGRAYRWTDRPDPLAFLHEWWGALRLWLSTLQDRQPLLYHLLVSLLVVVLVVVLVHALWVMGQTLRSAQAPASGGERAARFEVRGAAWYRREAERLAVLGRYPEAMQAEFLALVLDLDARRVLRFHPAKTPNEYTHEATLPEPVREAFRDLVRSLYRYAFARVPCGSAEFAEWRSRAIADRYAAAH